MPMVVGAVALGVLLLHASGASAAADGVIRVGSKSFTESYILAEIAAQVIEQTGEARVERRLGLGGTGITHRAIISDAIDLYPEYTGTLTRIILKDPALRTPEAIRARLGASGLTMTDVRVMEHALTYRALAGGEVDVMDVFSTDGQLERLRLQILRDDRGFFPDYSAVLLARRDMAERFPRTWARLREVLEGSLDDRRMSALNAMAERDGKSVPEVAAAFAGAAQPDAQRRTGIAAEIYALTLDHLVLVLVTLAAAIVLGMPMGIAAARFQRAGQVELGAIGMLQTVPALALLVFMIPLFGIGKGPALVALSLYALLP